jgi:hypothetical protein
MHPEGSDADRKERIECWWQKRAPAWNAPKEGGAEATHSATSRAIRERQSSRPAGPNGKSALLVHAPALVILGRRGREHQRYDQREGRSERQQDSVHPPSPSDHHWAEENKTHEAKSLL